MKQGLSRTAIVAVSGWSVLALVLLTGCGGSTTPTPANEVEAYVSSSLPATYEGALPAASQLVLGTLLLEDTADAVTPAQAQALLPLWQALTGDALQSQAEVNAVLGQIERAMTVEQLQAIAAMQLTQEDMAAWAQARGMDMALPPGGAGGTPGAGPWGTPGAWPRGTPEPGGPGGLDPQARETMRAGFDSMSEEERAQWMATVQAGGMPSGGRFGPGRRAGAGMGQSGLLLQPLIELLTQRAGS